MRCFKKSMAVTLALSMILGTPGIPAGAAKKGAAAKVQSVSIEKPDTKTLVLKKNEKYQLKTKVLVKRGISKKVTFKSSDRKVVTVSKKGRLAAKKKGTAKITVASMAKPSKKAVLTVKVGIPVKKVNLSDAKLTGKAGEAVKLKATVLPKDATVAGVAFTSSNAKIAKVSSKGKVSFLKEGKADITVKAQDGSGKKAVCKVEVTGAEPTATPAEPTVTPTEPTVTPTEPTAEPPATPAVPTVTPATPTATPATPTPTPATPTPTPAPATPTPAAPTATPAPPSNTPYVPYRPHVPATTTAPAASTEPTAPGEVNLIKNPNFAEGDRSWEKAVISPGEATFDFSGNKAVCNITNVGTEEWHVQLKQEGITIEEGATYKLKLKAKSTVARTIKVALMGLGKDSNGKDDYIWYGGNDPVLSKDAPYDVNCEFTINQSIAPKVYLQVSMGNIDKVDTQPSTITLSDFSLVKVSGGSATKPPKPTGPSAPPESTETPVPANDNLIKNGDFSKDFDGTFKFLNGNPDHSIVDGRLTINITGSADKEPWDIQLAQENVNLEQGKRYRLTFDATSDTGRKIYFGVQSTGGSSVYAGTDKQVSEEGGMCKLEFLMEEETDSNSVFYINMGAGNEDCTLTIDNIVLKEITVTSPPVNEEILKFSEDAWEKSFGGSNKGTWDNENKKVTVEINDVGNAEWDVQLKQNGILLQNGCKYKLTMSAKASCGRKIKVGLMNYAYQTYNDTTCDLSENAITPITLEIDLTNSEERPPAIFDSDVTLFVSMGRPEGDSSQISAHTIELSEFSLKKMQ